MNNNDLRSFALLISASISLVCATPAHAEWSPLARDVAGEAGNPTPDYQSFVFAKPGEADEPNNQVDMSDAKKAAEDLGLKNGDEDHPGGTAKGVPGTHPTETTLDPAYFLNKAHNFLKQNDYQSALNYVNRSLELQPDNFDASFEKALIYQMAGYDAAAARRYLALIDRKPEMQQAHIALGTLYRKHGNLDLAQKEYETVIGLNYKSFPGHYNLANVFMDQKKPEQALKEYQMCLKLQPNNALVHNNIGVIYQQRDYLEEAAAEFKSASHLDPANKTFEENYNNAQTKLGQKPGKEVRM